MEQATDAKDEMQSPENQSSLAIVMVSSADQPQDQQSLLPPQSDESHQQQLDQHEHPGDVEISQTEEIQHMVQRGNLTWATVEDATRLEGASVVSLGGHEGSVIVLGKMQDGQILPHRDDCQDILLMVELKYKDVLLQELQAQSQIQTQTETVHIKPHTLASSAPKTRVINYVTDSQPPGLVKVTPHLAFSSEPQGITNAQTVTYTDDQSSLTTAKTHLLAYDAQGNPQTLSYPSIQPLTIGKNQTISYISDGHTFPSTSHYTDGSTVLSKDQTLSFSTSATSLGPNTHVISFIPEYTPEDPSEQSKATFNSADGSKIEAIVFDESLSEHVAESIPETITGDIIIEEGTVTLPSDSLKPFPCHSCPKRFMRRTNLRAHMAQHSAARPHICKTCSKSFAVRWDLTLHERLHTSLHRCEICKKSFSVRGKLDRHLRVHSGERPFPCSTCGKAFSDKHNLDAHVKTHSDQRPYTCVVCSRSFRSRSHLRAHRRVHSQDTPFTCHLCGKSFKWKANLNLHLKVHNGERVKCDGCGREFARRGDLVRHRRSHEGLRPHSCTLCPRTYADRAALNKHMKSHQEHRPFTCDVCNKSFHFQWYLNSHKKMHLQERRHKCPVCDKEFAKRGSLTTHMKVHSGNLLDPDQPDSIVAVSGAESNSLEAEEGIHSTPVDMGGMKVEVALADIKVNLDDIKIDVSQLTSNHNDTGGVMTALDNVNPNSVVGTAMLNNANM